MKLLHPLVTPSVAAWVARLTDSAPVVEALPLLVICAWHTGFNPRDPNNKGASHGICPDCAAKLNAEMGARKAA